MRDEKKFTQSISGHKTIFLFGLTRNMKPAWEALLKHHDLC